MRAFAILLSVAVLVRLIGAGSAQEKAEKKENEAEKLFLAMEQKLAKAETVQVAFEGQVNPKIEASKWKGTLVLAGKNKVRISFDAQIFEEQGNFLMVADGAKWKLTGPKGMPEKGECPVKMSEHLLRHLTRSTFWPGRWLLVLDPEGEKRLDKMYAVSDFKLKGKEKLGRQETMVITYQVDLNPEIKDPPLAVTLWIDAQTQLPAKRVLGEGGSPEYFRGWKLGDKVDAKLFKVTEK